MQRKKAILEKEMFVTQIALFFQKSEKKYLVDEPMIFYVLPSCKISGKIELRFLKVS